MFEATLPDETPTAGGEHTYVSFLPIGLG